MPSGLSASITSKLSKFEHVPGGGGGPCMVRFTNSIMGNGPMRQSPLTDRYGWKHYLPQLRWRTVIYPRTAHLGYTYWVTSFTFWVNVYFSVVLLFGSPPWVCKTIYLKGSSLYLEIGTLTSWLARTFSLIHTFWQDCQICFHKNFGFSSGLALVWNCL